MEFKMYNGKKPTEMEIAAYEKIDKLYKEDHNELNDTLWHYMYSYLFDDNIDLWVYADEMYNYFGIDTAEEIVKYINEM